MRRFVPALVLTLAGFGCGSAARPTLPNTASEFGVSANASGPESAHKAGLLSPVRLTLRVADLGTRGGAINSGAVAIRDAQGNVLARATVASGTPIPSGGVGVAAVTLEWSASQAGRRVGWNLSVRDGGGAVHPLADTLMLP